jgi:hypothetical protein
VRQPSLPTELTSRYPNPRTARYSRTVSRADPLTIDFGYNHIPRTYLAERYHPECSAAIPHSPASSSHTVDVSADLPRAYHVDPVVLPISVFIATAG